MPASENSRRSSNTQDWTVRYRGIADHGHCDCPGCTRTIESGIAYFIADKDGDEIQVGPECVKKYDTRYDSKKTASDQDFSEPEVADLSIGMAALFHLQRQSAGRPYEALSNELYLKRIDRKPRLADEAYLLLVAKKLPGLGFAPASQVVLDVWQKYIQDRAQADLTPIRRIREAAGNNGDTNSLRTLLDSYAQATFIDRFLNYDRYRETREGTRYNARLHKENLVEPYRVLQTKSEEASVQASLKKLIEGQKLKSNELTLVIGLLGRVHHKRQQQQSTSKVQIAFQVPTQGSLFASGSPEIKVRQAKL